MTYLLVPSTSCVMPSTYDCTRTCGRRWCARCNASCSKAFTHGIDCVQPARIELPAGITLDNMPSTSNARGDECTRTP
eukprot:6455832-Pyramimonas_sp.AAC.1